MLWYIKGYTLTHIQTRVHNAVTVPFDTHGVQVCSIKLAVVSLPLSSEASFPSHITCDEEMKQYKQGGAKIISLFTFD